MEDYLRTAEAAKFMCVSLSKMTKMCHKKEVPYYKMGRINLFKKEELVELIEKKRVLTIDELQILAESKLITATRDRHAKIN